MEILAVSASVARQRTDCAIVGVYEKGTLSAAAKELDTKLRGTLTRLVKQGDVRGKLGETVLLPELSNAPCARAILVGLGPQDKFGRKQYRKAFSAAVSAVNKTGSVQATSYLSQETVAATNAYYVGRTSAEVAGNNTYRVNDLKSAKKAPPPKLKKLSIAILGTPERNQAEQGLKHGRGIVAGMSVTKDLGNLPSNVCTPTYLAKTAQQMARDHRGQLKVRVLDESEIRRLKMGSFL
ncbi:MAG TPA: M17 family peptidase N-terminal domain-containing protein, partial [Steroidobacteraceae bacterium]|nr:M17 family peptidase N-terminal domain-containing protein [Steroidobacteraceae bacterium]